MTALLLLGPLPCLMIPILHYYFAYLCHDSLFNDQCLPHYVALLENTIYKQYIWILILPLSLFSYNMYIYHKQTQGDIIMNHSLFTQNHPEVIDNWLCIA